MREDKEEISVLDAGDIIILVIIIAFNVLLSFLSGEKFAFGHHFLRPYETHHTPSRKFFKNELFRVPLYEIIKLEVICGVCCVMDFYTFCKGE